MAVSNSYASCIVDINAPVGYYLIDVSAAPYATNYSTLNGVHIAYDGTLDLHNLHSYEHIKCDNSFIRIDRARTMKLLMRYYDDIKLKPNYTTVRISSVERIKTNSGFRPLSVKILTREFTEKLTDPSEKKIL